MKFAALFCLTTLGLAAASPVEQVVDLLTKLRDTCIADGKHEQQIYDKYACWCETTAKRKASDINTGDASLRSLGQSILKLKGKVATLASEIEDKATEIKDLTESQEGATAMREKNNAAWMAESSETMQALAALETAIEVLSEGSKQSFIQGAQHLRMKSAVQSVLDKLPMELHMSASKLSLLGEFTKSKSSYAPQSATIQGMLGDMYTTFSANLEEGTQTEAMQNMKYEDLFAQLEKSKNEAKEIKAKKEGEKADAESELAATTKDYDETEAQKEADIKFFDETKKACEEKSEEWDTRKEMRSQELAGIKKALEILSSDEARAMFAKAIKPGVETFLQVESKPASLLQAATSATNSAYQALRTQATKTHSLRLASLAVSVRAAKVGHFDKVIDAIDGVIADLKEEEADDISKKDQCKDKYQEIAKAQLDLSHKIKVNKAVIAKMESLIEKAQGEKEAALEKKAETEQYIKDITKTRDDEHAAYKVAKSDDEAAIDLLEAAEKALAKFYKKEAPVGDIQGSVKLMQEPEFTRSADDAPDATFSSKGSHKLESKNILSIMAYLIEDLYDELSNSKKAEEKAMADFLEEKETAETLVDELEEKISDLDTYMSDRGEDKTNEKKDMDDNDDDLDAENKYEAKIKPDCDWIIGAFTKRADARAAEMNGLVTAKEYLAGMTSFAQTPKFDDGKLRSISFLGFRH